MLLFAYAYAADDPPPADDTCKEGDLNCAEIVVTASRAEQMKADATAPIDVIDRARIEATGATTLDEALRSVPGVQVTSSHGGSGISLQGLDPEHTLVLVDGRPLAGRVEGTVDLTRIPVADIERIEILPGPASALYGSEALGGVVNVVTRRGGREPQADVAARVGSRKLAEASGSVSGGAGPVSGGINGERNQQDGWDGDPSDAATTGDDVLAWGGRAWLRVSPTQAWSIDGDGDYHQRDTQGVETSGAGAVFDVRTLQETGDAGLAVKYWNGGTSIFRVRGAGAIWRQQYLENQQGSDIQDSYEETLDRRAYANASWQWFPKRHLVVVGLDGSVEGLTSSRLEEGVADRSRLALYAQDDWKVLDSAVVFAVSPGGRLDVDSQFGLHATPHLALRIDPVRQLCIRLTGGQGYRAPEFKELFLAFDHSSYGYELHGNPELKPETSTGGTADVQLTIAETVQVRGQGWWNEVSNLINPTLIEEGSSSEPAQYQYDNVGRAVTRGAQGGLAWVRQGPVAASVDYVYTDALNRDDGTPLDGRAPHRVSGNFLVRPWRVLEASATVEWNGERPYTLDGETSWSPSYTWVDARLAWTFHPGMKIEAGARNLLDARDDLYLGLAPRTFYVGVRADGPLLPKRDTP